MAKAALAAGLKEICFTDHLDYDPLGQMGKLDFDTNVYNAEYDRLEQVEDTAYYRTILESLQEGMSRVAQYINGTE